MAVDPVISSINSVSTYPRRCVFSNGLRPSEVWRIASPACTSSTDVSSSARWDQMDKWLETGRKQPGLVATGCCFVEIIHLQRPGAAGLKRSHLTG